MELKKRLVALLCILLPAVGIAAVQTKEVKQIMDKKQQDIVTVAALTAHGNLGGLKVALDSSLTNGMTVNEVKEVLVHTYAYCGFPRALSGLQTLVSVLNGRKAQGIQDNWGRKASPITDNRSKYERGKSILAELSGNNPTDAPKAAYAILSPEIEVFLKEHLFADIFERDVLTYQERELATISVIATLGKGVEPMLKGHIGIAMNIGISSEQLRNVFTVIEKNIDKNIADSGRQVLNSLLVSNGMKPVTDVTIQMMANGVQRQNVTFHNRFLTNIAAHLYLPKDYDPMRKYTAIIVGHPFGGVKEQTSGLYARKLAEMGYLTLAFDASHYGESEGSPRNIESPEVRVEDYSAAVDFMSNHVAVDTSKIGVIGICGGGCYSVSATQIDHRIKALATISMYDMGRARRQGIGDSQTYDQRMAILDAIGKQRTAEYGGAERKDIRALPTVVNEQTPKFAIDFLDYYDNPERGKHPNSTGWYSYTSLAPMMNFFPFVQIETISPRPVLFIVGEQAVSKYFSEDAYAKAAQPKELFTVSGATHVDLYDQPKYLAITLPKLDSFFKQYLK